MVYSYTEELAQQVMLNLKSRIREAASAGQWEIEVPSLRTDHARTLEHEGITVNPSPDDHDFEDFRTYTLSWK